MLKKSMCTDGDNYLRACCIAPLDGDLLEGLPAEELVPVGPLPWVGMLKKSELMVTITCGSRS